MSSTKPSRANAFLTLGAIVAVAAFVVAVLWMYRWRPTPGAVFLVLGWMSLLATGYFLARAVRVDFGRRDVDERGLTGDRRAELEREKKLLYKAIKEAEFDRDLKKLDAAEADAIIQRYRTRAIAILRSLDEGKDYGKVVEEELERRLAVAPPRACPQCQLVNDEDATFCKSCGTRLTA